MQENPSAVSFAIHGVSERAYHEAPQLMLVGTMKAATTSVYNLLTAADMGVCGRSCDSRFSRPCQGRSTQKEARFFDLTPSERKSTWGDFPLATQGETYRKTFNGMGHDHNCSVFIDATPSLYVHDTHARMFAAMPVSWSKSVRMVAILREPIARDLSMYNHMKYDWYKDTKSAANLTSLLCDSPSATWFPRYKQATECHLHQWYTECIVDAEGNATLTPGSEVAYFKCTKFADEEEEKAQLARKMPPVGDGDAAEPSSKHGHYVGVNRLTHGMYWKQIESLAHGSSRERLMVVNYDDLADKKSAPASIAAIVKFYGLPFEKHKASLQELPRENANDFPDKVINITCNVRDKLDDIFLTFNANLKFYLQDPDRKKPAEEPEWRGFAPFACFESDAVGVDEAEEELLHAVGAKLARKMGGVTKHDPAPAEELKPTLFIPGTEGNPGFTPSATLVQREKQAALKRARQKANAALVWGPYSPAFHTRALQPPSLL